MLGLVVCGLRTWMWTTAAPALAASIEERAICSGVTGTAGFLPGESAEPVTAHEMMILRCICQASPRALTCSSARNSRRGCKLSRVRSQSFWAAESGHNQSGPPACLPLCAALSLPNPVLGTNLNGHRGVCEACGALYGGRGGTDFQSGAPKRRRARADERAFAGLPSARGVYRGGIWYRVGASRHPLPAGLQAARFREAVRLRMRLQRFR